MIDGSDRMVMVRKTPVGVFRAVPGGPSYGNSFKFLLPKVPGKTWREIVAFFMHFSRLGTEACVQLFFDRKRNEYLVWVPEQKVSPGQVVYDPNEAQMLCAYREGLVLVADIHSHHSMDAFFSSVDNNDEIGVRLYGVFGRHRGTSYEILMRAGLNGHYCPLDAADVLDGYEGKDGFAARLSAADFPTEWLSMVEVI